MMIEALKGGNAKLMGKRIFARVNVSPRVFSGNLKQRPIGPTKSRMKPKQPEAGLQEPLPYNL
jgi:hypothetical protein